jgi:Fe-S cluster assembly ATP-binding protein
MRAPMQVLVGHPDYEVTAGTAFFRGQDLFDLEPEKRAHLGLFLRWVRAEPPPPR